MVKRRKLKTYAPSVAITPVRKLTALIVEERRKQFENGEAWALLDAIDFCIRAGEPIPPWASFAFCNRYLKWQQYKVRSLDEAFAVKLERKSIRLRERARREWLKPRIVVAVLQLHAAKTSIDTGLFETVGKKFGISATIAGEIYYEAKNRREFLADQP